jgi:hypothetical protein
MRTVTVRTRVFQIAEKMRAVARWLDAHGAMPATFHHDTRNHEMLVVRIKFAAYHEAGAFAGAFCRAMANRARRNERGGVGKYPRQ